MKNIEFYAKPSGEVIITENEVIRVYKESDLDFTQRMLSLIKERYTEAYEALCEHYKESKLNRTYYEFLIVRRFIKCNFFLYDNVLDIDETGSFHFEFVPCPLRGECKLCGIVCNPKYTTPLTEREKEVMGMYYRGTTPEQICSELNITLLTFQTHKRNAYMKLRVNTLAEFHNYATNNKLFV